MQRATLRIAWPCEGGTRELTGPPLARLWTHGVPTGKAWEPWRSYALIAPPRRNTGHCWLVAGRRALSGLFMDVLGKLVNPAEPAPLQPVVIGGAGLTLFSGTRWAARWASAG